MTATFVVEGPPRTKKTSNRIVTFHGRDRSTGKPKEFHKLLPSEQFEQWFKDAMTLAPFCRRELEAQGLQLPVSGPVQVTAIFYRDADRGDLTGYMQALADWMQSSNKHRTGAGIIVDDVQIYSWDGSRLAKDAARPRIEVLLQTDQEQLHLGD